MSRRTIGLVLGVGALVLLLSACNSGKVTGTAQTSVATRSAPASTATAATTTSIPSSNGSATAVLPAQFTVNADGSLSPPLVGGPVGTTILLTLTSKATHPVRIFVSSGRFLTLPAGGHASVRLTGLKPGRYGIFVEGQRRAAIVVGAQPGP